MSEGMLCGNPKREKNGRMKNGRTELLCQRSSFIINTDSKTEGDFVFFPKRKCCHLYYFRLDLKTNYKFFNDTFHFNMKCIIIIWKER